MHSVGIYSVIRCDAASSSSVAARGKHVLAPFLKIFFFWQAFVVNEEEAKECRSKRSALKPSVIGQLSA